MIKTYKDKNGVLNMVISVPPSENPTGELEERTLCTLYEAMRFTDGEDIYTANPVYCDVEFRLLRRNLSTGVITAVTSYQTGSNVSGLNITWPNVDNTSGYRYYGGYKKCIKHSGSGTFYISDFFGDDSGTHLDPGGSADSGGGFLGPVPANTSPDEWTAAGATFSGCNVLP